MRAIFVAAALPAAALLLSACGQKGPLYLPEPASNVIVRPPPAAEPTPAPPAVNKEYKDDSAGGFTRQDFEAWADARFGPPDGTARYWYAAAPVRDADSGKTLYVWEYYDAVRQIVDPGNPQRRIGIARKLDLWRDKDTHALLERFDGAAVPQMPYPYQLFEMEYENGAVALTISQGRGEHLRSYRFTETSVEHLGQIVQFTVLSHFASRRPEVPGAPLEPHTMASTFIVCERDCGTAPRHRWVHSDVSPVFPWAGGDGRRMAVQLLIGTRFDSYDELPLSIRSAIESRYPEYRNPPRDLAEVRDLQR